MKPILKCKKCDAEDHRQPASHGTAVQVLTCPACGTPHRPDDEALRVCVVYTMPLDRPETKASYSEPGVLLFYSSNWEDALQAALSHLPSGTRFHDVISTMGPLLVVPRKAIQGFIGARGAVR
jgi:hypothetical protein